MKTNAVSTLVYSKVYVNGIAVGVEKTTESTTYINCSDDITNVKENDLIQIYVHSHYGAHSCYIRNMKLRFDKFINNDYGL
jgi:hypothetical protein